MLCHVIWNVLPVVLSMGLLSDTQNCALGKRREFSPPPRVSDSDMYHSTRVTPVSWCMPGSLTGVFLWSRWRGELSRHSRCMRNPQFCVSGKRPMPPWYIGVSLYPVDSGSPHIGSLTGKVLPYHEAIVKWLRLVKQHLHNAVIAFRTTESKRSHRNPLWWLGQPSQIARSMGPTWGPPGSCRPLSPMLAPWTLLSGMRQAAPHIPSASAHQNTHGLQLYGSVMTHICHFSD